MFCYCCEPLEQRRLLAVSLTLSGLQTPAPGATINVSADLTFDQSEMMTRVNPTNPLNVVGLSHRRLDPTVPIILDFYRSTDGGANWLITVIDDTIDGFVAGRRFDPALTFDSAGRLYLVYGITETAAEQTRLVAVRSSNGGASFDQFSTVAIQPNIGSLAGLDKWVATTGFEPQLGDEAIYIACTRNVSEGPVADQRIVIFGSRDAGSTWLSGGIVNDSSLGGTVQGNLFACPAVGPAGQLYVSWHESAEDEVRIDRDLNGLWAGGVTFGGDTIVRSDMDLLFDIVPAQPERGIFSGPVIVTDTSGGAFDGRLYMVVCDRVAGQDTNIQVGRSDNNGVGWSFTTIDANNGTDFLPWIDVDQTSGSVNVIYYTTDGDQGTGNDDVRPRIAVSINGGVNWNNANLSALQSNEAGGYGGDYLEYIGLDVHDGTAHGLWASRYAGGGDDLDAHTAWASFNNPGTTNTLIVNGDNTVGADDTIVLRRNFTNSNYIEVLVNGVREFTGLLATLDEIDINPGAGTDLVIVDFLSGSPIPAGGLDGTNIGSFDTLRISGSGGADTAIIDTSGVSMTFNGATITWNSFLGALEINSSGGADTITVNGLQAPLTANGSSGDDTFFVGGGDVDSNLLDPITINGQTGSDSLFIDDLADGGADTYTVTFQSTVKDSGGTIIFDTLEYYQLDASNIAGTIQVNSSFSANYRINGNGGADTIHITGNQTDTFIAVDGGAGLDTITVNNDVTGVAGVQFVNNQDLALLDIFGGGRVNVPAGGDKVLRTGALHITGTGFLDLFDNDMIIDYAGASPLVTIQAYLTIGYAAGAWNGPGIRSTTAGVAGNTGIGFAEATDLFTVFPAPFSGQSVDNTSVLAKYTFNGDTDLNGNVNLNDFNDLAANFGASPRRWVHGNFDFNNNVNLADFNELAANFGMSGLGPSSDWDEDDDDVSVPNIDDLLRAARDYRRQGAA